MFLPRIRIAIRLTEVVVDDRAARSFGEARHQPILEFRRASAATLDDAGAELTQHVRERKDLAFVGPQCGDVPALWIVMTFVARDRKPERTGLHALAHHLLHLRYLVGIRRELLACLAHAVVAHGPVADQI